MEVGVKINQYEVVEHIGRGGMADVWSARDTRLNRMVAIKTIATGLSQDIDPVGLFKREAQTIAQMEHPHILPIYDFGEFNNSLYIVMRFVTGGSLEGLLEKGPLPINDVLKTGREIASALDHAHTNKVIHLDLKPPNILLDSARSPYVGDFGLATTLDREGRARNPGSGTLLYMAPEQLVAEVIDHRADIYSFSIMLYHMLTGQLPFDGTVPLALKQLQYQEDLPDVDLINSNVPYQISDILRRGTAQSPDYRPETLSDLIDEMAAVLSDTVSVVGGAESFYVDDDGYEPDLSTGTGVGINDAALLEAVDIYSRARHAWAGGQGRFLLGITHFMLMSDYYSRAQEFGLTIDQAGYQMLVRGALEHYHNLEFWWEQVNDDDRRWVCLHTIRSENPTARIRALYRLETLPDDPARPTIPKLVAQGLQVETYDDAKIAALQVLGTRSRLVKPAQEYQIVTEFRGRLLTSMTRLGIQIAPTQVWQEAVYTPEIDLLVAETALDQSSPPVAAFAARIVGRMRSLTAVRNIANAQRRGRPGALRALALVRDEAPYLPSVVSREGRLYAWLANSLRRVADHPYESFLRFLLAMLGGWIAMGQWIFIGFRSQALFSAQRWGNTFAIGLLFGLFVGLLVLVAGQFSERLRGFWSWWIRLLVFGALGIFIGITAWSSFTSFFLNERPELELMRMGGLGLAFGFIVTALLNLRGWQAFLVTAGAIYVTLFASYYNFCQQFFVCLTEDGQQIANFSIAPVAGLGLIVGVWIALFIQRPNTGESQDAAVRPAWVDVGLSALGGFAFGFGAWLTYLFVAFQQRNAVREFNRALETTGDYSGVWVMGWDTVTLIFLLAMFIAIVGTYLLQNANRRAFVTVAVASFGAFYATLKDYLLLAPIVPQWQNPFALFNYLEPLHVITLGIPIAIVISLGGHGQLLLSDVLKLIGKPAQIKERNGLLSVMLSYTLFVSMVIATLSLFTIQSDARWAFLWIVWGTLTFVFALATWRWKKWGAQALMVSAMVLVILSFIANAYQWSLSFGQGIFPPILLDEKTRVFWTAWAIVLGIFTWGTARRYLWGGIGLIFMALAWMFVALFTSIPEFMAVFAVTNVAILAYTISPDWDKMETRRLAVTTAAQQPVEGGAPARPTPVAAPIPELVETDPMPRYPRGASGMDRREDMMTEFDVQERLVNLDEDVTELSHGDLKTEFDVGFMVGDLDSMKTQTAPDLSKLKLDTSAPGHKKIEPEKPPLKIDTGPLTSKHTDLEPKAFTLDTSSIGQKKKDSEPSSVKPTSDSLPDTKTQLDPRANLNLDFGTLSGEKSEMDTRPTQSPKLNLDTSHLRAREMKTEFDVNMGQREDKNDENDDGDEDE